MVHHEGLYAALFNGRDVGLRVRALKASHAEAKLLFALEECIRDKRDPVEGNFTIDFNLERWLERKDENAGDGEQKHGGD